MSNMPRYSEGLTGIKDLLNDIPLRAEINEAYSSIADPVCEDKVIENTSGELPLEFKVLILPDDIEETDEVLKSAKSMGIEVISNVTEREQMKQVWGTLIAIGGNAFEDWKPPIPKVGDKVKFAKWAGYITPGEDGKTYRTMNDKDLAAVKI